MSSTKIVEIVPKQVSSKRRKAFLWFITISGIAFLGLATIVKISPSLPLDLAITKQIQQIDNPIFNYLMHTVSVLGNSFWGSVLIVCSSIYLYLLNRKGDAFVVVISGLGATILSMIIKNIIGRPRPDGDLINQLVQLSKDNSFPSGHVLFFVGIFGFLIYVTYLHLYKGLLRTVLLFTFSLMILLIGVSRIYLGVHWFSDVLGSLLIGVVWLYLIILLSKRLNKMLQN